MATFNSINFETLLSDTLPQAVVADQMRSIPERPKTTKANAQRSMVPSALTLTDVFMNAGLTRSTSAAQSDLASALTLPLEAAAVKAGVKRTNETDAQKKTRDVYQEVWAEFIPQDILKSVAGMTNEQIQTAFGVDKDADLSTSGSPGSQTPPAATAGAPPPADPNKQMMTQAQADALAAAGVTVDPAYVLPAGLTGDWIQDVLAGISAPNCDNNRTLMDAWQRAEGGVTKNNATYNWLNTTEPYVDGHTPNSINDKGVQAYETYAIGISGTVKTLLNGYYGAIIDSLRACAPPCDTADAIWGSPWGTGAGAKSALGC